MPRVEVKLHQLSKKDPNPNRQNIDFQTKFEGFAKSQLALPDFGDFTIQYQGPGSIFIYFDPLSLDYLKAGYGTGLEILASVAQKYRFNRPETLRFKLLINRPELRLLHEEIRKLLIFRAHFDLTGQREKIFVPATVRPPLRTRSASVALSIPQDMNPCLKRQAKI